MDLSFKIRFEHGKFVSQPSPPLAQARWAICLTCLWIAIILGTVLLADSIGLPVGPDFDVASVLQ